MSKRNLIFLIITLIVILLIIFGFLYFNSNKQNPGEESPGINFISQFNPFGKTTVKPPTQVPPSNPPVYQPNPNLDVNVKLRKISSMPIAGFIAFSKERLKDVPVITPPPPVDTSTSTLDTKTSDKKTNTKPTPPLTEFALALRYVDRATGNVYQTFADKILEKRFTATIIPKIYEAYFGNKGESVVLRYLKNDDRTIQTFVGTLPKESPLGGDTTENNEIKGVFLPEDIKDISLASDISNIFYLFNFGDNTIGTTMNLATKNKAQVFESAFSEWLSFWPNNKMITLTTKPTSLFPGYMYVLDLTNKNLRQVLGNINGLTTLTSPDGKLVLFGDNTVSLSVYNLNTKSSNLLGVKTLPEKCVWGKLSDFIYCAVPKFTGTSQYPDVWYQGEVSFSDQIWKINITDGNATLISDPATVPGGESIDGIKLALDDGENYLFFVNKKDSFLWELNLK